ncbi:ionotropic receptor 21a-like [Pieris napi]|uniref:ionotropic receptor 21a-like n=1 Tax=Pieris napi TaxID=78633 RepID=UPI001FB94408|nr:ionotropic receptor 21a-like [Pieris napi]
MNVFILLYSICFMFWCVKGEVEYYPSMGEIKKIRDAPKVQHTRFNVKNSKYVKKRGADPVFHGHPKTKEELWRERFLPEDKHFDQVPSLIRLIHNITLKYLTDCTPVLLYDNQIFSETKLFRELLRSFPVTFIHGYIDNNNRLEAPNIIQAKDECLHFILFLTDVQKCHKVLGTQSNSKVVVIARSSQWAVQEYLGNPLSRLFINLLIVSPSFKDDDETLVSIRNS